MPLKEQELILMPGVVLTRELAEKLTAEQLADFDCQTTLFFADGSEQTFTILRNSNLRWSGMGADSPLVKITSEWFYNPARILDEEEVFTSG